MEALSAQPKPNKLRPKRPHKRWNFRLNKGAKDSRLRPRGKAAKPVCGVPHQRPFSLVRKGVISHALPLPDPLTATTAPLIQQGDLIGGKYRIGPVIGSGGVATVYRATHVWTEREVAVKVLDPSVPHFERMREAFLREARTTVQLDHPNVVDVLDMGEDDWATAYMVMELLQGPTLRDVLLEQGTLSEADTLGILVPLVDALEKAHELGIVHRDFKPENIMLVKDAFGTVAPKLIDFGVAEILQKVRSESLRSQSDIVMGTPQYMSPEQARDQRAFIGPHTDVWGVGVVWYECLTGRTPFDGDTSMEILEAVCAAPIDFESLPTGCEEILRDALERSVELRIGSLSELKVRIEESGVELPSVRPPEPIVSSWAPAPPDEDGVQRTLAGLGPNELLSAPPAPPEIQVDSELLNVPFKSQRKIALAGVGLALAVVLAAWWTVRGEGSGDEAVVIPEAVSETVLEPGPEPVPVLEQGPMSEPEPDPIEPAQAPATGLRADTDAAAAAAAAAATDADADADAAAGADAATARDEESAGASAPKVERKAKARRKAPAKRRPKANDTEEMEPEGTPGLVTEW